MLNKDLPSPELLRKLLRYEPETGKLFWRERTADFFNEGKQTAEHNCAIWNGKHAGNEAFTTNNGDRYKKAKIFRKKYFAHRVIWAMVYGTWPKLEIDHINGIRSDNRLSNLREVTRAENAKNLKRSRNNTSGVIGVSWNNKSKKWYAEIVVNCKIKRLGYFDNIKDATFARKEAEKKYGFHPNHGRNW